METTKKTNLISLIAFFALIAVAILELLTGLNSIGVNLFGQDSIILTILNTIKNIGIVLVIGLSAYKFVENKNKKWKITYFIAIGIFIASTILMWF